MPHPDNASQQITYAGIMVPVDLGPEAERRVKLACRLADRFSSRLIGIAAEGMLSPGYLDDGIDLQQNIIEMEERRIADDLEQAEKIFRATADAYSNLEWRATVATMEAPSAFICRQARACDLIVVSRQGANDPFHGALAPSPGDLMMNTGRPILVVPPKREHLVGDRIVIAWKDTREARRALWDSLPFLKRADTVFVVAVGPSDREDSISDVSAYLARHGVASRACARSASERSVAHEIIQVAEDEGADLIVSGAYGHSRAREWIFGGVTRELLNNIPVCCLFSH
ncbi:MAG TPA: universal stress protein [Nitrococcus sp.]|nr:universal stress protein [Nitrococcus sp.]